MSGHMDSTAARRQAAAPCRKRARFAVMLDGPSIDSAATAPGLDTPRPPFISCVRENRRIAVYTQGAMDKHDASTGIRSMRGSVAVVAIGGPSCSGKSTLVEALRACWGPEYTAVLPIDAYYRDHAHLPMEERMKCNFDAPETIDWALLTDQLAEIIAGTPLSGPSTITPPIPVPKNVFGSNRGPY